VLREPVAVDARPDLPGVPREPHRIQGLADDDVPALLGEVERMRAAQDQRRRGANRTRSSQRLRLTRGYVYAVRRGDLAAFRSAKYARIRRVDLCVWLEARPSKGLAAGPLSVSRPNALAPPWWSPSPRLVSQVS
jgi:hypothetical protein